MRFLDRRALSDWERFRNEFDDLLARFGRGLSTANCSAQANLPLRGPPSRRAWKKANSSFAPTFPASIRTISRSRWWRCPDVQRPREEKRESEKVDYIRREIRYGAFERSIRLPEGIKAEDLKATYRDGILELSAPMPKEAAPKEVKIQVQG